MHSTKSAKRRVTACRECNKPIESGATGRPRVVCSHECERARRNRERLEVKNADAKEAGAWWDRLTWDQRCAAVAWARRNPAPSGFTGGRYVWAYFNRAEFSCEGRPTAIEGTP